jgi:hypothetical protein
MMAQIRRGYQSSLSPYLLYQTFQQREEHTERLL